MCCFVTALFLFGPRLATVIWYFIEPLRFSAAFQGFLLPCLGFIFLPWTLLAYLAVYPMGVEGFDWSFWGWVCWPTSPRMRAAVTAIAAACRATPDAAAGVR